MVIYSVFLCIYVCVSELTYNLHIHVDAEGRKSAKPHPPGIERPSTMAPDGSCVCFEVLLPMLSRALSLVLSLSLSIECILKFKTRRVFALYINRMHACVYHMHKYAITPRTAPQRSTHLLTLRKHPWLARASASSSSCGGCWLPGCTSRAKPEINLYANYLGKSLVHSYFQYIHMCMHAYV